MNNDQLDLITKTTEDENQELIKLLKVKKHILNFLNKKELVKFLVKLVNKSKTIKFQRNNPEDYINPSMPILELELLPETEKSHPLYKEIGLSTLTRTEILNIRANIIRDEILTPFSNLMIDIYQVLVNNKEANTSIYRKDIDKILISDKIHPLSVNSIYKVDNESELLFIFSLVYAVNFPYDNENIDITKDFSCAVEFLI